MDGEVQLFPTPRVIDESVRIRRDDEALNRMTDEISQLAEKRAALEKELDFLNRRIETVEGDIDEIYRRHPQELWEEFDGHESW